MIPLRRAGRMAICTCFPGSWQPVTTPILTRHGWLIVYHGVSSELDPSTGESQLCYSGMADDRIGVARLDLPDVLPPGGVPHSPNAKV